MLEIYNSVRFHWRFIFLTLSYCYVVVFSTEKKDTHGLNSRRLAEVWMDEYKRLFYHHRADLIVSTVEPVWRDHLIEACIHCDILSNLYIVFANHVRAQQNVVLIHRWSLYTESVALNIKLVGHQSMVLISKRCLYTGSL